MNPLNHPMYRFCLLLFCLSLVGNAYLKESTRHKSAKKQDAGTDRPSRPAQIDQPDTRKDSPPPDRFERKGMTWGKRSRDTELGIEFLGCWAYPNLGGQAVGCDAYHGDTPCSSTLPILCVKVDGSPRPAYDVYYPARDNQAYYGGWLEGTASLSKPVQGMELGSKSRADKICAESLGEGWRMAEHHDGLYINGMSSTKYHHGFWNETKRDRGGWNFYAYTKGIPDTGRYWVSIDDQKAHCWD